MRCKHCSFIHPHQETRHTQETASVPTGGVCDRKPQTRQTRHTFIVKFIALLHKAAHHCQSSIGFPWALGSSCCSCFCLNTSLSALRMRSCLAAPTEDPTWHHTEKLGPLAPHVRLQQWNHTCSRTCLKPAASLFLSGCGAAVGGLRSGVSVSPGVCWAIVLPLMEGTGGTGPFSAAAETDAPAGVCDASESWEDTNMLP